MNSEFKRMQQLAGLTEIKIIPSGLFQKVSNEYIKGILDNEGDWEDDPEALEYLDSLKQNLSTARTADEAAREIQKIDDTLTEFAGQYLGDFYHEAVANPLIDIGKKTPSLRPYIKEILEILHKLYGQDDTTIQQYEDFISDQWRDDRIYQDILEEFILSVYSANFRGLLGRYDDEAFNYINQLNNFPPKINTMEELASNIRTINDTIYELEVDGFSYKGVDEELNKVLASHPEYESVIHSLLGDDWL